MSWWGYMRTERRWYAMSTMWRKKRGNERTWKAVSPYILTYPSILHPSTSLSSFVSHWRGMEISVSARLPFLFPHPFLFLLHSVASSHHMISSNSSNPVSQSLLSHTDVERWRRKRSGPSHFLSLTFLLPCLFHRLEGSGRKRREKREWKIADMKGSGYTDPPSCFLCQWYDAIPLSFLRSILCSRYYSLANSLTLSLRSFPHSLFYLSPQPFPSG